MLAKINFPFIFNKMHMSDKRQLDLQPASGITKQIYFLQLVTTSFLHFICQSFGTQEAGAEQTQRPHH